MTAGAENTVVRREAGGARLGGGWGVRSPKGAEPTGMTKGTLGGGLVKTCSWELGG